MGTVRELSGFYRAISEDSRIGATHISLYMAFFQCWNENRFENPVTFTSRELMPMAKIDSRATYHKCLNDLVAFGYIEYVPSRSPLLKSRVFMK